MKGRIYYAVFASSDPESQQLTRWNTDRLRVLAAYRRGHKNRSGAVLRSRVFVSPDTKEE